MLMLAVVWREQWVMHDVTYIRKRSELDRAISMPGTASLMVLLAVRSMPHTIALTNKGEPTELLEHASKPVVPLIVVFQRSY